MKKFNLCFIVIFIILCSLLISSASYAIPLEFVGVSPREVAKTNGGGVYAGIYNLEVGNDYKPYDSFCIEFDQWAPSQEEEYTFQSLESRYSQPQANAIAELWFDNYASAKNNSEVAAGLQIAIWEVTKEIASDNYYTPDNYYSVFDTTSNFYITDAKDYGATDMLKALNGSDFASLISLTNDFKQDYVVANPVPEPASMMLFGTGLIGLAAFTRRRLHYKK